MQTIEPVIISGSHYFRYHLGRILEEILPTQTMLSTTDESDLLCELQKKPYKIVVIEGKNEDAISLVKQIKQTRAETRVILFNNTKRKIKEADFVFPNKISKATGKKLKAVFSRNAQLPIAPVAEAGEKNIKYKKITVTVRQLEVFEGIWEGLTNEEIDDKLFISVRTVEEHRKFLYDNTQSKKLLDLVKFAIKEGWINRKAELSDKFKRFLSEEKECIITVPDKEN